MKSEYNELIINFRNKIQELITLYNKLKEENIGLRQELSGLSDRIEEKEKMIREIEEKNEKLRLGKALTVSGIDTNDAKARINLLVREIDKCIALLNR